MACARWILPHVCHLRYLGHPQEPEEEDEAAALSVDWRAYSQTHTLTDKQQKLAEKIRKRENRVGALQKEVEKIRVRVRHGI